MEALIKFLSYVLRHAPQSIDLSLDPWASVDALIEKSAAAGRRFDMVQLLVATSDKRQSMLSDNGAANVDDEIRVCATHKEHLDLVGDPGGEIFIDSRKLLDVIRARRQGVQALQ